MPKWPHWLKRPAWAEKDPVLGTAGLAALLWILGFESASILLRHNAAAGRFLGDWVSIVPEFAMIALTIWAARRAMGRLRGFWMAFACSSVFWLIGDLIWNYYEYALHRLNPYPSLADLFYLASCLSNVVALLIVFRISSLKVTRSLLDISIVLLTIGFIGWKFLIEPGLGGAFNLASLSDIGYPILALGQVMLFFVLGLTVWRTFPRSFWFIAASMVAVFVTDTCNTYVNSLSTYSSGSLIDVGWQVQMLLVTLGALVAIRLKETKIEKAKEGNEAQDIGMIPLLGAVILLVVVDVTQTIRGDIGDAMVISAAILALVTCRLLLTTHLQGEYNDYFRVLIDTSPLSVIEIDMEGKVLLWNASAEAMYGYTAAEVIGKPHPGLATEEGKESIEEIIRRFAAGERTFSVKTTRRGKDGSTFTYSLHVSGRHDSKGCPLSIIGLGVDVSEQEQALQELSESRELYRLVVENSHDMIALLDAQGRFIFVSPSYEHSLGYGTEELTGVSPISLIHPADVQAFSDALRQVVCTHTPSVVELRIRHKSGRWVYAEGTTTAVLDEDGKFNLVLFAARDLSDRQQAEEELRDAEARYRFLVEQLPMAVYICTSAENGLDWTYLSPQIKQVAGCEPALWINDPEAFAQALHPEDRERVLDARERAKESGLESEYRLITPAGEQVWIREEGRVIRDLSGSPLGLQGYLLDVTQEHEAEAERHHLESQLVHAQKMEAVGQLAAGIAHDFNNLLMAISGHAELAQSCNGENKELEENLDEIRAAVGRAAGLSQQLLEFSRYQEKSSATTDLVAAFKDMQRMLKRIISEAIEMHAQIPDEPLLVHSDPGRLEQILLNLVVNARDAIEGTGRIDIILEKSQFDFGDGTRDCACLRVRDSGQGMTEETRAHIFEPFFTTKEVGKGTGLGLSTVYGIVQQADGLIDVASTPGRGTTFTIYLPLVKEDEETVEPPQKRGESEGRWL